jgi:hypothetical protein
MMRRSVAGLLLMAALLTSTPARAEVVLWDDSSNVVLDRTR